MSLKAGTKFAARPPLFFAFRERFLGLSEGVAGAQPPWGPGRSPARAEGPVCWPLMQSVSAVFSRTTFAWRLACLGRPVCRFARGRFAPVQLRNAPVPDAAPGPG